MTNDIDRLTLQTSLEKLTVDTYSSQVTPPELQKMLDAIPVEIQLYDGLKDVSTFPRKTFYALKDKNYLPDISFEQRQKLEEKAMTLIRPQISTEWKNYIDTVAAGSGAWTSATNITESNPAKEILLIDVFHFHNLYNVRHHAHF